MEATKLKVEFISGELKPGTLYCSVKVKSTGEEFTTQKVTLKQTGYVKWDQYKEIKELERDDSLIFRCK
jgi:hypothetical protein